MKAERRHELKENDLSHALSVAQEYLSEHGRQIGLAVGAVVVIVIVLTVAMRSRANALETAWKRKGALTFTDPTSGREALSTLKTLADGSSDPTFVLSSLLDIGANALRLAQQVEAPPDAELNLQAQAAYEKMLSRFPSNPIAVGAAHVGLATVAENQFAIDGDMDHKEDARQHLQAVIDAKNLASTPYQLVASDRLAALDRTFTRVRWAEPKPAEEETASAPTAPPADETIKPKQISFEDLPEDLRKHIQELQEQEKQGAAPAAKPETNPQPAGSPNQNSPSGG
ncbi:MAG: hypothetical protein J5J06_05335 [Phycisphaerae bacterium]|nr:hypothetical protein [Phycisphaerae bacterium]